MHAGGKKRLTKEEEEREGWFKGWKRGLEEWWKLEGGKHRGGKVGREGRGREVVSYLPKGVFP